ncbi:fructokinase [Salinibacillus kushneri]|uniref:fructokinase n=1 Tax=Salinibacillus kushneri TaxID=237682 RepID=A0A1I0ERU5_9BACI|nr:ROK family protein [Salinibacillus kushneri]SET48225.1 fructokinase [Salinibacillus kushneri]
MLIGSIEAGGTKFVCAVGDEKGLVLDKTSFSTEEPDKTLAKVESFFKEHPIEALGVGTFGPVDLDKTSNSYGTILKTPKIKWQNYPFLQKLKNTFHVPVAMDTDVNTACLGEYYYGAAKEANSSLYITVGTGIGAGLVQNGQVFQGKNHSEMGHIFVQKHPDDDFKGSCPSHGACIEGLASGPAIEKRYGKKGYLLAENPGVWEMEAFYLAQAIMNYFVMLSPEKIILGGGVMKQEKLYQMVQDEFMNLLNGYLAVDNVKNLIVKPELKDEQGVIGAIMLGVKALKREI